MNGDTRRDHARAMGWSLGTVVTVLTILSLLGLLPWATRAEHAAAKVDAVREIAAIKADIGHRLDRMERQLDDIYRAVTP